MTPGQGAWSEPLLRDQRAGSLSGTNVSIMDFRKSARLRRVELQGSES